MLNVLDAGMDINFDALKFDVTWFVLRLINGPINKRRRMTSRSDDSHWTAGKGDAWDLDPTSNGESPHRF